jgi:hypothetical protein
MAFARARRVQTLFVETYSLIPLNAWLSQLKVKDRGRYSQIVADGIRDVFLAPGGARPRTAAGFTATRSS